jgi:hypothetical protein
MLSTRAVIFAGHEVLLPEEWARLFINIYEVMSEPE